MNPKTYKKALAYAQNKALELNEGKPKQARSSTTQANGNSPTTIDAKKSDNGKSGKPKKPKKTPDEKARARVEGGFLSEAKRKEYMTQQQCFFFHTKGHHKQDCPKWKAKQAGTPSTKASTSAIVAGADSSTPSASSNAVLLTLQVPTNLRAPIVHMEYKQKGTHIPSGLMHAHGYSKGHKFTILFDPGSSKDLISPQLVALLECTTTPTQLDVDDFTPKTRYQIMQQAIQVPFQVQQVEFQRNFYITPLTRCDMLLGIP